MDSQTTAHVSVETMEETPDQIAQSPRTRRARMGGSNDGELTPWSVGNVP